MKLAYAIPLTLGALLISLALAEVPEAIEEEGLITVFIDTSYVILDLLLLTLSMEGVLIFTGVRPQAGYTRSRFDCFF